ncbi:unnamed protein product [Symbiodinium sp. KB8]|nr:unnamed protein product [Symbiodinium sp. KB8]
MYKGVVPAVGFCNAIMRKALIALLDKQLRARDFHIAEWLQQRLTKQTCIESLEDAKKMYTLLGADAGELKQVCLAECEDLIEHIIDNAVRVVNNLNTAKSSLATLCSAYVVKVVENRELWNFMGRSDRIHWQGECCSEKNIIIGSERYFMCQSVLSNDTVKEEVRRLELPPSDPGIASFVGENEELQWTELGAKSLNPAAWAVPGKIVHDSFLRVQPLTFSQGLKMGFWRIAETRIPKTKMPGASLLQGKSRRNGDSPCHVVAATCHDTMIQQHWRACGKKNGLKIIDVPPQIVKADADQLQKTEGVDELESCNQASDSATAFLWADNKCYHITDKQVDQITGPWETIDPCDWEDEPGNEVRRVSMFRSCDGKSCVKVTSDSDCVNKAES